MNIVLSDISYDLLEISIKGRNKVTAVYKSEIMSVTSEATNAVMKLRSINKNFNENN